MVDETKGEVKVTHCEKCKAGEPCEIADEGSKLLSYGEKAVGLTFNPSNDQFVQKVKELYAQIIDICNEQRAIENETVQNDPEKKRLYSIAITEAQTAQMWAVKAITWK